MGILGEKYLREPLGYNLRADMWGHGYTAEAIQALIEYINSIRPISVIEGEFAVENHNSQRVMEKLGWYMTVTRSMRRWMAAFAFLQRFSEGNLTDKEPGRRRIRIDTRSPRCFFAVSAKLMRHPSEWYRHSLFVECF